MCILLSCTFILQNVGFNIRDDIVLFDFGLAREIFDKEKVSDGTWKLTGETGSLRYMAPEVANNKPYGMFISSVIFHVACFIPCISLLLHEFFL